jgi:4-diphosphocytidyl-2-C-methyl-D-erythritol kinase
VIAGLAALWGIPTRDERLQAAAASVGADVPFFLHGGTGLYEGRGDVLDEWLPTPGLDMILLWPGEPVSTAEAYRAIDADAGRAASPSVTALTGAIHAGDTQAVARSLHNDFTPYSADMVAGIADALAWLEDAPAVTGSAMAGSGSGVFGICESAEAAEMLAEEAGRLGWWAVATRSSARGVHSIGDEMESQ